MYIPFDSEYFQNQKIVGLFLEFGHAATVWPIKLWCWASKHARLTGAIPKAIVESLIGWSGEPGKAVDRMLTLRLLDPNGDTVVIHDWKGSFRAGHFIELYEHKKASMRKYYHDSKGKKRKERRKGIEIVDAKLSDSIRIVSTSGEPPAAETLTHELVDLWNHGKPATAWIKVSPKRISKVKARLADKFTPEQIKKAIANGLESDWHRGVNPTGWRPSGPEWFLNTFEKCEEWARKHEQKAPDSVEELKRKFIGG